MHHDPIKIIQISDTHLFADSENTLLGVNTQNSFQAVFNLLQSKNCDLIIHSGDISQDKSAESYERFADIVQELVVPVYYIPGNHDDEKAMLNVYPYHTVFNDKHIILKRWHIILLNTQQPGEVWGFLNTSQLQHLEHCLQQQPDHYALIAFHHHPFAVGSAWLDQWGLRNADQFWKIISAYPQIKALCFGHVHQVQEKTINGVLCYSAPSTCFQFKRQQDIFGLENLSPGYRWVHLYEDGRLQTGIERVSEYIGVFDAHAKGY